MNCTGRCFCYLALHHGNQQAGRITGNLRVLIRLHLFRILVTLCHTETGDICIKCTFQMLYVRYQFKNPWFKISLHRSQGWWRLTVAGFFHCPGVRQSGTVACQSRDGKIYGSKQSSQHLINHTTVKQPAEKRGFTAKNKQINKNPANFRGQKNSKCGNSAG